MCVPSVEEWKSAEVVCNMSPWQFLVHHIQQPATIFMSLIWKVKLMLQKDRVSNQDGIIKALVHKMKLKFQKYWKCSYIPICIPIILDPRFKYKCRSYRPDSS